MAASGILASFKLGATTYSAADCLQSWQLAHSIQELIYQCSGVNKAAAGAVDATFSVSLALAASDTTKHAALDAGSTGAFEAHPGGDSSGFIEITATDSLVTRSNTTSGPRSIISYDLTIRLQDITLSAAT